MKICTGKHFLIVACITSSKLRTLTAYSLKTTEIRAFISIFHLLTIYSNSKTLPQFLETPAIGYLHLDILQQKLSQKTFASLFVSQETFASLFYMPKREHFRNKRVFYFTSKVLLVPDIIKF